MRLNLYWRACAEMLPDKSFGVTSIIYVPSSVSVGMVTVIVSTPLSVLFPPIMSPSGLTNRTTVPAKSTPLPLTSVSTMTISVND